jgi:hypothetical protein
LAGNCVFIRSFVFVCRGSKILSYRLGRYRDDRDPFLHKRSIGFTTLVNIDEHTLFNVSDMGIVEAGVRAVKIDLDIPPVPPKAAKSLDEAVLRKFIWISHADGDGDLTKMVESARALAGTCSPCCDDPGASNRRTDASARHDQHPVRHPALAGAPARAPCEDRAVHM